MQAFRHLEEAVERVLERHPEYHSEAYTLVHLALGVTVERLAKPHHLSARELYLGCCAYAIGEYGPLAGETLAHWGVTKSADFGAIVYNLIEVGIFARQKEDSQSEFNDLPPLDLLLSEPFLCGKDLEDRRAAAGYPSSKKKRSKKK